MSYDIIYTEQELKIKYEIELEICRLQEKKHFLLGKIEYIEEEINNKYDKISRLGYKSCTY